MRKSITRTMIALLYIIVQNSIMMGWVLGVSLQTFEGDLMVAPVMAVPVSAAC